MTTQHLNVKIGDQFRSANKQGSLVNAIVTDVFFDKVGVQLNGNGTILRGLRITGGPVEAGDEVQVDFSTNPPLVIAKGNAYLTADDLEAALKKIAGGLTGGKTRFDITLFSGGGVVEMFTPTIEGLNSAVLAAGSGDLIVLPDIDITIDLTIPQGVALSGLSSRQSIIRGTVTLNQDCTLENLTIIRAELTTGEINAVIAQGAGFPSWIKGCEIHAYNCGTGLANAIKIQSNTDLLQVTDSVVVADSKIGAVAHAFSGESGVSGEAGTCKIFNCRLFSKSASHYDGSAFYEYSNIGTVTELERACFVPNDNNYPYSYSDSLVVGGISNYFGTRIVSVPTTPNAIQMLSGSANAYPGTVARVGDYIYFFKYTGDNDIWIHEYRISDGNNKDVFIVSSNYVHSSIDFVVLEERKLLVYLEASYPDYLHSIYLVQFEEGTSDKYYEFHREDPIDYGEGDYKILGNSESMMAVRDINGDLIIILFGFVNYYDVLENKSYGGLWLLTKNWTADGSWNHQDVRALTIAKDVWEDSVHFYGQTHVVQGKYLTIVSSYSVFGAEHSDFSNVDEVYVVMFVYDLDTEELVSVFNEYTPTYGSFPDLEFYNVGVDHTVSAVFGASFDFGITNASTNRVYKFDPIGMSITVVHTTTPAENTWFISGKSDGYAMVPVTGGKYDVYKLSDFSLAQDDLTWPSGAFRTDGVLDDNNGFLWFFSNGNSHIYSFDPTTGGFDDFDPGVAAANVSPSRTYFWALGNVFVIFRYKYTGPIGDYWLVKET